MSRSAAFPNPRNISPRSRTISQANSATRSTARCVCGQSRDRQSLEATGEQGVTDGEQSKPSAYTYPIAGVDNLASEVGRGGHPLRGRVPASASLPDRRVRSGTGPPLAPAPATERNELPEARPYRARTCPVSGGSPNALNATSAPSWPATQPWNSGVVEARQGVRPTWTYRGDDHFTDPEFLRWLALKRAFFWRFPQVFMSHHLRVRL